MTHIKLIILMPFIFLVASIGSTVYLANWAIGIFSGVFDAGIMYGLVVILILIIGRFIRSKNTQKTIILFLMGASVILLISLHWYLYSPSVTRIYKMALYSEPPPVISDLKGCWEYPGKDAIFLLRFETDSAHCYEILNKFTSDSKSDSSYIRQPYLKKCACLPWWNIDTLITLPQFSWTDERWHRNLWYERRSSLGKYTVYITGF